MGRVLTELRLCRAQLARSGVRRSGNKLLSPLHIVQTVFRAVDCRLIALIGVRSFYSVRIQIRPLKLTPGMPLRWVLPRVSWRLVGAWGRHRRLKLARRCRNLGHQTLHLLEELLVLRVVHLVLPSQVSLEQRLVVVQLLLKEVRGNRFYHRCFGPVVARPEAVGEESRVFV